MNIFDCYGKELLKPNVL